MILVAAAFPRKVLVVRLGAIGDVVNALVFATALKEAHPAVEIGWAVHELACPLVEGHPSVDRVHVWRRQGGNGGWTEFRRLVTEVRKERYELAVDLQRIFKSALLARLSGAKRVLGYDRERAKEASWLWTNERIPSGEPSAHMVEQYLEFVRYLGVANPIAKHVLPRDPEIESWADAFVSTLGAPPVVIGLGATKPANRWLPERFGELAVAIRKGLGDPVVLIGSEADRAASDRAWRVFQSQTGITNLVSKTSLPQLAALLARARVFIGCDTGPMHLAAAGGTPVVALFGPADPRRTGPWGNEHRIVSELPPCAPCNRKTCNQPRHACMEDITVELVLAAVKERLAVA